jgi:hypothetical protein
MIQVRYVFAKEQEKNIIKQLPRKRISIFQETPSILLSGSFRENMPQMKSSNIRNSHLNLLCPGTMILHPKLDSCHFPCHSSAQGCPRDTHKQKLCKQRQKVVSDGYLCNSIQEINLLRDSIYQETSLGFGNTSEINFKDCLSISREFV